MTYLRRLKIFLAVAILGLGVSSCLDDQPLYDKDSTHNVIEFYTTDSYSSTETESLPRYSVAFAVSPEETFNATVSYSGPDNAPEDIQVTIATDTAVITKYNNDIIAAEIQKAIDAGDDPEDIDWSKVGLYDKLPEELYSIPSSTVTIPKGQRKAKFQVKLKIDQFDFTANYAIVLTIKSASTGVISGNNSTVLWAVSPKNILDGVYNLPKESASYEDLFIGPTATADYPRTIHLVTKSANSVAYFDPQLNSGVYGYAFNNGPQGSLYGNWAPLIYFDGETITKVENYFGQGAAGGGAKRSGKIDPAGKNKISKDDKGNTVIEVSYFMTQGGTGDPTLDAVKLSVTEKFVYTGPRP